MSGSMLIKALAIILFLGILFTGIVGSFATEEDLENSWVSEAGIDKVFGIGVDLIKYPISAVTIIIDFMDGDFWDWLTFNQDLIDNKMYANISGTGTNENVTLDGTYIYFNNRPLYNITELAHEEDTGFLKKKRKVRVGYNSTSITGINITAPTFWSYKTIYTASDISETEYNYILNVIFDKIDLDTNWENTSSGQLILGEEYRQDSDNSGYESNAEKVFNFFDEKIKPSVKNAIKSFGLIPEVIGIPIFILLLVAIIYPIIKLFPFT